MRGKPGTTPGCGTTARFWAGCTCDRCRYAYLTEQKAAQLRRLRGHMGLIPRVGTTRRLHALQRIGWSLRDLAPHAGYDPASLGRITQRDSPIFATTAARIADVYDRLHMTPGTSKRAIAYATRMGWAPPLAWDDIDDPDETPASQYVEPTEPATTTNRRRDPERSCARCGITKVVNASRYPGQYVCQDCQHADPQHAARILGRPIHIGARIITLEEAS